MGTRSAQAHSDWLAELGTETCNAVAAIWESTIAKSEERRKLQLIKLTFLRDMNE